MVFGVTRRQKILLGILCLLVLCLIFAPQIAFANVVVDGILEVLNAVFGGLMKGLDRFPQKRINPPYRCCSVCEFQRILYPAYHISNISLHIAIFILCPTSFFFYSKGTMHFCQILLLFKNAAPLPCSKIEVH